MSGFIVTCDDGMVLYFDDFDEAYDFCIEYEDEYFQKGFDIVEEHD